MIRNYLKTAWRNLLKNKFYSAINIVGLTAGLAIGILILLWVQDELSFDSFHKQTKNIYRLELFGGTGASRQIWSIDVAPIGPLAKQQLPDVQEQVRITRNYLYSMYKYQDKVFGDQQNLFVDASFFSVFDYPLIKGNAAKPFTDDNSVIITQKTAKKYFGDEDPIGKVIVADNKVNFTVSGLIKDFPPNSSMQCDMIMPMGHKMKDLLSRNVDVNNDFSNFEYETYFLLKPGVSTAALAKKLFDIHIKHKADDTDVEYLLLPLEKMHLYNADGSNRGVQTVRIFIIVAMLILVIACINYVNLSTARSMLRSKEISMRKIIGASKWHLFMQFIVETALLFSVAAVCALGLIYVLMPVFNQLSGKQLVFNLRDYHIWMIILATITGTLAASSIYPALLLSSFEPLKALKGKITAGIGDALFRKVLVVTQFSFSIMLIIGTIVITRQLSYIHSKDLGYDKSHVFGFWMRDMDKHYDAVRAELLKQPGVVNVTRSSSNIVNLGNISGDNSWDGKAPGQTFIVHPMAVDKDFISFFKMKMVQGSSFTGAVSDSTHFILNEAAVKEIGMKNPVGKRFRQWKTEGTIIGVVKDFHFASMREKIAPAIFCYRPDLFATIYVKTTGKDAPKAINEAQAQFKQYNGEYPFGYAFMDEIFDNLYKGEQRQGTLFNYLSAIAIVISCLGLLGLAAYTAQIRTREIGVRKILGASVNGIVGLLAKDFIKLVFIAILIATPIAWYAMSQWLQNFTYRIQVEWWVFVLAGFLAVLIAFITIGFQSVKAALANPVKSLRSE
ncbi:ABC transporter permease [Mucilaginibacter gynuensis]|uniref:ABC transporter permease n=1 Tax=Mucilaginibacter gynuensis TaxID=1302236 RepID=A0ABP8FUD9_9SPHI